MTDETDKFAPLQTEVTEINREKNSLLACQEKNGNYKVFLTIIKGNETDFGKIYSFQKNQISIGRHPNNDIAVNDNKMSKNHCEISIIKNIDHEIERIVLQDLNSTNGTFVNSELVQQKILKAGDKIETGNTIFRFSFNDEIEEFYQAKLFNFATTDSLTGLYNKRYVLSELENQCRIAYRNQRPFSIILMDIDNFKTINDLYGHLAGDEFLKYTAFLIESSLREQDICGRFGGEEFLIVLPETNLSGAFTVAERIRGKVEISKLKYQQLEIHTTVSIGINEIDSEQGNITQLLKIADQALYQAKKTGKNKVSKPA
jgi:diguanylate cyclase (GGDEF)-like protein